MTLNILKLSFLFSPIFLEFIITLRETLQKFVEKHQFNVIFYHVLIKQMLDNYMSNIYTCTLLALSSKICTLFLSFFWLRINCLAL